jgi:filamentous hemagglutinin family protein
MKKRAAACKGQASKRANITNTPFQPKVLSQTIRNICLYSAGALIGQTMLIGNALAAPQGGQVVGGQGGIQQNGTATVIQQNTQSMAINWQSFNVSNNESVQFIQPSSSAAALNRILDQNPSQIHGSITANGKVFLLNANGIIFGKDATVNVGSLVAGTLDMSARDFMDGRYDMAALEGKDGVVINRGLIKAATGGSVTLVGGAVVNEGVILADYGQVNLAAGRKATLDFDGDGLIRFEVSDEVIENAAGLDDAVKNSGTIQAEGGQVLLTAAAARDVFTNVVNNEGVIRAGRIDNQGGVVRLVGLGGNTIHSGSIDVSGQDAVSTGGTVHVLGDNVGLFDNASIDASGATGGGTVLVGGDYQGNNPDIKNAENTYVSADSTINADATDTGNGGKVIVWADESTHFYGAVSAKGGMNSGDGGFVEVSGKNTLTFDGSVNTTAPNGNNGILLLDPANIVIENGDGGNGADDVLLADGTIEFTDIAADTGDATGTSHISETVLEGLSAATDISLQATNSIIISDLADDALTLATDGTVEFLTGAGGFSMNSNDSINITGTGSLRIDAVSATSGGTGDGTVQVGGISTTGGGSLAASVTLKGTSVTVNGAITTGNVTTAGTASGDIIITATTGTITLNNNLTTGNATVADTAGVTTAKSGDINLEAATGINGAGVVTTGDASVDATTDDASDTATSGTITLNVTGAGDVGLSGINALTVGAATVTNETSANEVATVGDIVVTSADAVNNGTSGSALDVSFGSASGSSSNTVGKLVVTTDGSGAAGEIRITTGEALSLGVLNTQDADATTVDISVTADDVLLTVTDSSALDDDVVNLTADKMDITNTITTSGTLTLSSANAGDAIDLGSAVDTTANTLELSDAELDNITATTLVVGGTTGILSITAALTPANVTNVTLIADKMDLANTLDATGGIVTLSSANAGDAIDLGSAVDTTANTLELSDAELRYHGEHAGAVGCGAE